MKSSIKNLREYRFNFIYELAELIDVSIKDNVEFWNYNESYFLQACVKFSKNSLLHLYISATAMNFYRREFRKNGDLEDDETMEKWYHLFESYQVSVEKFDFESELEIIEWFNQYSYEFEKLFDMMAEEVFYILFPNRKLLLTFNTLVSKEIQNAEIDNLFRTLKGTIKRTSIPQWVKKAVYHRDKGRCVFCNIDLTNLINTLTESNYDHIVPLDLHGANDPCNIQLACESCNKKKRNKLVSTSNQYIPWWS